MKWFEFLILASVFALFVFGMYQMFNRSTEQTIKDDKKNTDIKKPATAMRRQDMRWTKVTATAPWEARDSGEVFTFQNKIWMMGGINGNQTVRGDNTIDYWKAPHFNDIWHSRDGVQWHQATTAAEWPPRRSMSVALFKGHAMDVWWVESKNRIHKRHLVVHRRDTLDTGSKKRRVVSTRRTVSRNFPGQNLAHRRCELRQQRDKK